MNKKILIVEDDAAVKRAFKALLSDSAEVIFASTVEEAKEKLDKSLDWELVAVDGKLVHDDDGVKVVQYARAAGYRGLIIAISGGDNQPLVQAGADAQVQKTNAASYLCEQLA